MADDSLHVSACVLGTDCTDCGGVDKIVDYTKAPEAGSGVETCTNTYVPISFSLRPPFILLFFVCMISLPASLN